MNIEILDAKTQKVVTVLSQVPLDCSVGDVKVLIAEKVSKLGVSRQAIRLEPKGKGLNDEDTLTSLQLPNKAVQFYVRDLGPQIPWKTVFLVEYLGPLFVYPIFFLRPELIYGPGSSRVPIESVVYIACACWSFHYAKRVYETLFVHRFSHGTMPFMNLFKNCGYYWGFTAFVSYFVNHPLYTSPSFGRVQVAIGLAIFVLAECGNYAIHMSLRDLRPAGTKTRRIPQPTANPFTRMTSLVSCPNYTYEIMAWTGFSLLTQCLPALMFTLMGLGQMTVWAQAKHRNYRKEFKDYPKGRKAIVPFVI